MGSVKEKWSILDPHNLSHILPHPQQGRATRSQAGVASGARRLGPQSLEGEASRSSVRVKHQSGSQECGKNSPRYTTHPLTLPESAQTSTLWTRQLTPEKGISSAGWGKRESKVSPRLMLYGGECSTQERCHLQCRRMT